MAPVEFLLVVQRCTFVIVRQNMGFKETLQFRIARGQELRRAAGTPSKCNKQF